MKILSKTTKHKAAFLASIACLFVGASTAAQQPAVSAKVIQSPAVVTFFGCVDNTSGSIRVVSNTTACKSSEHKIHWSQKGPRGPQGPQGLQGAQGPQGPAGISVGYSSVVSQGAILPAFPGTLIAKSSPVAASGTYFISASALVDVEDNSGVFCYDTTARSGSPFQFGGSTLIGLQQASITDAISVSAGDSFQLWCSGSDNDVSELLNAGITATLINSAFDTSKKPRHPRKVHPPATSATVR